MKKLITLLILLISINVKAIVIAVPQIPTDSSKITYSKVYNDVKEGLKGLAKALKVGTEQVWNILVKQQFVNSIVNTILIIINLFLMINIFIAAKSDEDWQDTAIGVFRWIQIITAVTLLVLNIIRFPETVTGYMNPEYLAIHQIIEFIK